MAITAALAGCEGKEIDDEREHPRMPEVQEAVRGLPVEEPVLRSEPDEQVLPGEGEQLDAPTATPEPDPGPPALELRALICAKSWPCAEALAVVYGPTPPNERAPAGCPNGESGGNPGALSLSGLHAGLYQLHAEWHGWRVLGGPRRRITDPADLALATALLLEPRLNIDAAFGLYEESGWSPWSCRP